MSSAKGNARPIVIVKRYKKGEHAHHGGAWKVAYADFVTAMMAFFLVMWLVTAVSKEQRAAIFDYFKNPSMEPGKSVRPAPGQMGPGGASTSPINLGGGLDAPKSSQQKTDRIGATVKHPVEELRSPGQAPGNETGADLVVSGGVELIVNPLEATVSGLRVAVSAADEAEAARAGHGGCERPAGHSSHGGKDDRMINTKKLGNTGAHWRKYGKPAAPTQPGTQVIARAASRDVSR